MSDAASSAAEEGPLWSETARIWVEHWARLGAPARELIAGETAVGPGMHVLDMGCGSGEFCALAAARGATVAGIDAAEGMLALARERLPAADLRHGAIEQLPWAASSFDLVTGFNSFQFAAEPDPPFREARRVVREGGRVAVCVWGPRAESQLAQLFDAVRAVDKSAEAGATSQARLGDPGVLERRVQDAGLQMVKSGEIQVPYATADLDELEQALELDLVHGGSAETIDRDALRSTIVEAAADSRQENGSYRFENRFRWIVASA
jgi:SAM-dependent methyltransferase